MKPLTLGQFKESLDTFIQANPGSENMLVITSSDDEGNDYSAVYYAPSIMITELSESRLALLRKLKDVRLINASKEDISAIVKEHTTGLGADVVIICAPSRQAHEQSIQFVRKGGAVSFFASLAKGDSEIVLDSRAIHYGELRVVGVSDSRPEHVAKGVQMMAQGKIDLESLVTHRVSLEKIHDGLELMKNRQCLKVIVRP